MTSYIGQSPVFGDFPFQVLTGDNTNSYTMSFKVSNENGVLIFLNGAVQRPGIDYTAGGDSLVFSEAVPNGVQIFAYGMGLPKSSLSPSNGASLATPTLFDNSEKIATTEFVNRAVGNLSDHINRTTGVVLTGADVGVLHSFTITSAQNVELPLAADVPSGALIYILNTSSNPAGILTVVPNAADAMSTYSGNVSSIEVKSGELLVMRRLLLLEGWTTFFGNATLKYGSNFAANKVSNGYQKLPSGLIIQWGFQSTTTGGYSTITYPIAFPNAMLRICGSSAGTGSTAISAIFNSSVATATTCPCAAISSANTYTTNGVGWIAIGY